jgi:hypothetical protein
MKIGFAPCGFTSKEIIKRLIALGGINRSGYDLIDATTSLYWYIESTFGDIKWANGNVLDYKLNPNNHKEIIKSLEDLPSEIKELIKQRQVDAGNKADLEVFKDPQADTHESGFNWVCTREGSNFWHALFIDKQYYKFYTLGKEQTHEIELQKAYETELQGEETSIGRSKNITGSRICCKRCKPTIAGGHLRDRKAVVF